MLFKLIVIFLQLFVTQLLFENVTNFLMTDIILRRHLSYNYIVITYINMFYDKEILYFLDVIFVPHLNTINLYIIPCLCMYCIPLRWSYVIEIPLFKPSFTIQ